MSSVKELQHLRIPLSDIKSATNDFGTENLIGHGGFGKVYRGDLCKPEGRITVAVKRLDLRGIYGQGQREFLMEITMLSRYQHENIVSLLGFCDENGEKILVYKHMIHGSLDKHLRSTSLTWCQRLKICCGAARGLSYLHDPDGGLQRVLHRDIKSSNILLDEEWKAKISDFGLSKIGPANQEFTFLVSNALGTFGYCDPVYMETGILTKESDIYSFGVVLFEVLCGRLGIENYNDEPRFLAPLARKRFEQNELDEIIDDDLKVQMDPSSLAIFAGIAYRCLRKERDERPTMVEVVEQLETALDFQEKRDANDVQRGGYEAGHFDSQSVLSAFKQYRLREIAEFSVAVSVGTSGWRIEFDKDDEFFATGGDQKRIQVYEFSQIVNEPLEVHKPLVDISTSSTICCLSWNKGTKNHLATADYDMRTITVWDVNSQQVVRKYHEHRNTARSVDFSYTEPSMLVSGGFDNKVKVWSTKQEKSSITISAKAAVYCVRYHPHSGNHIAVAAWDHCCYYYDLRNTRDPLHIFKGHNSGITYVKFLANEELATASIDSTIRLWDLKQNLLLRTFKGHKNVYYYLGFSAFNDFIACGCETNEVVAYHKSISKPLVRRQLDTNGNVGGNVVNDVCWKRDSPVMIASSNNGSVKILALET